MNNYNEFNNQNVNTNETNVSTNQFNENNIEQGIYKININNSKRNDKKVRIIIICIILIILVLLLILIGGLGAKKDKESTSTTTTTTTITEKVIESKELIDEISKVSIKLNSEKYYDKKLVVKQMQGIKIENAIAVYDIKLIDENNNNVKVENTNLIISIPYNNINNYTDFKVLYLDESNSVLETLNANYKDGKIGFEVNHLSRFAIIGTKVEQQTTTKTTTTRQATTQKTTRSTTQRPNATQRPNTTQKPTTTKRTTTTQPTTQKPTTTQPTTQAAKTYTVRVIPVDDYSPSVEIKVYENGSDITSTVKSISYENGTYLCSGQNATVMKKVVSGVSKFLIELSDGQKVKANVK